MTSFKKTRIFSKTNATSRSNSEAHYWKKYEFPITVKEFTLIDYINICPIEPFYIAVTSGPKIDIYHQQTAQVWKSLTRFQKCAYGGKFRRDGQLLIAGSEESQVKLFNFRQNQLLRVFKGHKGPVHRTDFVCGKSQIVSFSDDKSIRLWDVTDEKEILRLEEHKDFIRAGVSSITSEHIVISGSYDHTVKIWDSRAGASVMTLDHGSPVQDIICYPSGSVVASAGGTEVKVWDIVGGKLLSVLSQHHKTITCLSLATNNTRLLSGSLDRHVKVYDLNTYSTFHSKDYPAPILSIGVAPKDSTLVTGMLSGGSGLISFEQRTTSEDKSHQMGKSKTKVNSRLASYNIKGGDEFIGQVDREKMSRYDRMLARFEFSKTLDIVLQGIITSKTPDVTVVVLKELIRRGGLGTAMAGRDAKSLFNLHRFLIKNIRNPNYHGVLIEVANTLLDIYGDSVNQDPKLLVHLTRLNEELLMDLAVTSSGISLMGAIEMFLSASSGLNSDPDTTLESLKYISTPSPEKNLSSHVKPGKEVVVNVL